MATLVLTAVGTALGGPIGGAIGALIGNQLDRTVLGTAKRQGPRLGDLAVQTSSYGSQIPRLFGTMRVAGTVIWATDLREDTHHGGGKAGGGTTTYSYSASFAVALSARPILSVGRIWADGKLLRGVAGDWKSETGFRLHIGGEDQPIDPLIASAEGLAATPAHRGIAYAVFEDLQLADFGNRIPSLTFEVTADPGDVAAGAIAAELGEIVTTADEATRLTGFAASGDSVRSTIETLAGGFAMALSDDGATLRINDDAMTALPAAMFGASSEAGRATGRASDRQAAAALPDSLAVAYYEPARDYQAGMQRARRDGIGRREERLDLPIALAADQAKAVAEAGLVRRWRNRDTVTVRVPWRLLDARVGTRAVTDDGAIWRVTNWTLDRMTIELKLQRTDLISPLAPAEPGRAAAAADDVAGATRLVLLDLPGPDDTATTPQVWLAAAGTGAGWRRASVEASLDAGMSWQAAGQTALPAIMGTAIDPLPDGPATLFDRRSSVEIELLSDDMTLTGADEAQLIAGANMAAIGDELIQFGSAVQIGVRRFRLFDLLRGRRGSEAATALHRSGEPFVLIDPARLLRIDVPLSAIGTTLVVNAIGPGDGGVAATASLAIIGRAVRPPGPVHLSARRIGDGTIQMRWVRRSRAGWSWHDEGDAPLGEDAERYRLRIMPASGMSRTIETLVPSYDYLLADQAADGAVDAASIRIELAQLGTRGASAPPASATFTIGGA